MFLIRRTLAVAALAVMTAAAFPALAADQAPAAAPATTGRHHHGHLSADSVEARIKTMHDQLQITAAQASQWDSVAQVMRDNAKTYSQLVQDKVKAQATMTAVESLQAYQQIAQAHADGVKKLAAAFETLYATMSPEQQKTTDAVFRGHKHHHHHAH